MNRADSEKKKMEESSKILPVKTENLRLHFKKTYKLEDDQIDLLLASSARSLKTTLAAANEAFETSDFYEKLAHQAHSMKGLLLNMGEEKWAAKAREIELSALEKKEVDYKGLLGEIVQGVRDIT